MRERIALATLLAAASPAALAAPEGAILQFGGAVQARTCDILVDGKASVTSHTLPTKTVAYMNTTSGFFDSFLLEVNCSKSTPLRLGLALAPGARGDGAYLLNMATVNPAENMALYVERQHGANGVPIEHLRLGDRSYSWSYSSSKRHGQGFIFANGAPSKDLPVSAGNYETALQFSVEYQ